MPIVRAEEETEDEMPIVERRRPTPKVRWSPDFNAGTLSLIITIGGGIFYFGGELRQQRADLESYRAAASVESAHLKESIITLSTDVKSVQSNIADMKETLTAIKTVQQERRQDIPPRPTR